MPAIDRSLDHLSFLPDSLREGLRRRMRELGGLALIVLAMLLAIALATWSVQDPSLSHATNAPVRNLLGFAGAIVADLLTQLLGVAAIALVLPIAVWGWRLVTHRALRRERLRILIWVGGVVLAAAFAACLPRTASWPLPVGLGGIVGDALLRLAMFASGGALPGMMRTIMAAITAAGALVAFGIATGIGWHDEAEEEDEDKDGRTDKQERTAISLGWIAHGFLSLKSRLARLFARRRPDPAGRDIALDRRRRAEPRFENYQAALRDLEHEVDEEDDELEDAPRARKPRVHRPVRRSSGGYVLPPLNLLATPRASDRATLSADMIQENATALESVLGDFGVRGEIINARPGPVVTLYELEPAPGIKSSRVIGLADDIARSMSALSARVAVVSGRNAIGIELPNPTREKVYLRELLSSEDYDESSAKLPLCLGKTIGGESVIVDLSRMPHLLIAGTTGSGKSVAINTMIPQPRLPA